MSNTRNDPATGKPKRKRQKSTEIFPVIDAPQINQINLKSIKNINTQALVMQFLAQRQSITAPPAKRQKIVKKASQPILSILEKKNTENETLTLDQLSPTSSTSTVNYSESKESTTAFEFTQSPANAPLPRETTASNVSLRDSLMLPMDEDRGDAPYTTNSIIGMDEDFYNLILTPTPTLAVHQAIEQQLDLEPISQLDILSIPQTGRSNLREKFHFTYLDGNAVPDDIVVSHFKTTKKYLARHPNNELIEVKKGEKILDKKNTIITATFSTTPSPMPTTTTTTTTTPSFAHDEPDSQEALNSVDDLSNTNTEMLSLFDDLTPEEKLQQQIQPPSSINHSHDPFDVGNNIGTGTLSQRYLDLNRMFLRSRQSEIPEHKSPQEETLTTFFSATN